MPEWIVQRDSSLEYFLRGKDVQQWRIPVLIACGAVEVFRYNSPIALTKGPRTHVDKFDKVRLADPLSKACLAALQKEADVARRDYALAPGTTRYDVEMGKLLERRPDTIRITDPFLIDLVHFVKGIGNNVAFTHPVRHITVGSHANAEGHMRLKIGAINNRAVSYDDLLDLVKSKAIVIDPRTLEPRPVDPKTKAPIPAQFIMRGCRVGHQVRFVQKLKEALGNKLTLAAALHYHLVAPVGSLGSVEYLGYAFELSSPTRLKDRAAVIAAMTAQTFKRIDGSTVPSKAWSSWVPSNPHQLDKGQNEGEQRDTTAALSPIDGRRLRLPRVYRYKIRRLFDKLNGVDVSGSSTKAADRKKAVRDQLVKLGFFREKSGFPLYERFEYKSVDEFMDAWEWQFDPKTKAKSVKYNAVRHEYRIVEPIAELEKGKRVPPGTFILNFFPARPRGKSVEMLLPDDPRLFTIV